MAPHFTFVLRGIPRTEYSTSRSLTDFVSFDYGNMCMVTGGRNMGRAGVIIHRERHIGGFDIVHVRDAKERLFATR